jgi:hypothetical protein
MQAPEPHPPAEPPDAAHVLRALDGLWEGTWFYPDGREPGAFHVTFSPGEEGALGGTIREPNTITMELVGTLGAAVDGRVEPDGAVRFTKRYDGQGGASHEVDYVGRLAPDSRSLFGEWRVDDLAGPFVIHLDKPAGELPLLVRARRSTLTGDWTGASSGPGEDDPVAALCLELQQTGERVKGDAAEDDGEGMLHLQVSGVVTPEGKVRLGLRPPGDPSQVECHGWLSPNERSAGGWWERGSLRGLWHLSRA